MSYIYCPVLSFPAKRFPRKNLRHEDEKSLYFNRFLTKVPMTDLHIILIMCEITNNKKQTPNKHQKTKNEIQNKKILEFK